MDNEEIVFHLRRIDLTLEMGHVLMAQDMVQLLIKAIEEEKSIVEENKKTKT